MRTFQDLVKFTLSAGASALIGKRFLNCVWELTYRCNARCAICSYWRNPSDPAKELTLPNIQEGLDKIFEYGCRVVNFTGGEPTLRCDLEDIVSYAADKGMWTSIVTNASLLTRDRVRNLKDAGLDSLLVSLDSTVAEIHDRQRGCKGLYPKVVRSMQWLRDDFLSGHRMGGIMCVLSSLNSRSADKIVKFADELGVYVLFQPYHVNKTGSQGFKADLGNETVDIILKLKERFKNVLNSRSYLKEIPRFQKRDACAPCSAGYKYFSIDPYGFLHPCVDTPAAGHLLKDDISVVRSQTASVNVRCCPGCWYCFRGEADCTLSLRGCLEKIQLGVTVIRRNAYYRR